MQEQKPTLCTHFHSIGKTDCLKTIAASATQHKRVFYSHQKPIGKHLECENQQCSYGGEGRQKSAEKFKRTNKSATKIQRKKRDETGWTFWPTDIIHDKTGKTIRNLRSYLQTHKVNTYIKLQLPDSQSLSRQVFLYKILQGIVNKNKRKYFKLLRDLQPKLNSTVQKIHTRSETGRSKSMIRIDYELITIPKRNHKNKTKIIYYCQSPNYVKREEDQIEEIPTDIDKFYKNEMTKEHSLQKNNQIRFKEREGVIFKKLDIHEREYLTPNTSTYFGTTIQSNDGSEQKNKNKTSRDKIKVKNLNKEIATDIKSNVINSQYIYDNQPNEYEYDSNNEEEHENIQMKRQSKSKSKSKKIRDKDNQNINNQRSDEKGGKTYKKLIEIASNPHIHDNFEITNQKQRTLITLSNNV